MHRPSLLLTDFRTTDSQRTRFSICLGYNISEGTA
jgi:hypothetical protein